MKNFTRHTKCMRMSTNHFKKWTISPFLYRQSIFFVRPSNTPFRYSLQWMISFDLSTGCLATCPAQPHFNLAFSVIISLICVVLVQRFFLTYHCSLRCPKLVYDRLQQVVLMCDTLCFLIQLKHLAFLKMCPCRKQLSITSFL